MMNPQTLRAVSQAQQQVLSAFRVFNHMLVHAIADVRHGHQPNARFWCQPHGGASSPSCGPCSHAAESGAAGSGGLPLVFFIDLLVYLISWRSSRRSCSSWKPWDSLTGIKTYKLSHLLEAMLKRLWIVFFPATSTNVLDLSLNVNFSFLYGTALFLKTN
jgi:hypothetical protein